MADLSDEQFEGMLKVDGFDDCVIGIYQRCGQEDIIAYNTTKIVAKLVSQGMTEREALEYFDFNIAGAYAGETTPCFISLVE